VAVTELGVNAVKKKEMVCGTRKMSEKDFLHGRKS
jgi:hypothetical protein